MILKFVSLIINFVSRNSSRDLIQFNQIIVNYSLITTLISNRTGIHAMLYVPNDHLGLLN